MRSAQLRREHNAQLSVMQLAYSEKMTFDSPRQQLRRHHLEELIQEAGDAATLARLVGTPKTHISAIVNGKRGIGDVLSAKLETMMTKPTGWMDTPRGSEEPLVARAVSLNHHTVLKIIQWEALMSTDLPPQFVCAAPDDSMSPRVREGQMVTFDRTLEARPGDGVLVVDGSGNHYIREYRQRRPGVWEAHAASPAYQPLESEADALRVVAVVVAVQARWA